MFGSGRLAPNGLLQLCGLLRLVTDELLERFRPSRLVTNGSLEMFGVVGVVRAGVPHPRPLSRNQNSRFRKRGDFSPLLLIRRFPNQERGLGGEARFTLRTPSTSPAASPPAPLLSTKNRRVERGDFSSPLPKSAFDFGRGGWG
jgi:hypothetical protein